MVMAFVVMLIHVQPMQTMTLMVMDHVTVMMHVHMMLMMTQMAMDSPTLVMITGAMRLNGATRTVMVSEITGLTNGAETSDESLGRPGSFPTYGPQWAQSGAIHLSGYKGQATEGGMRVPLIVRHPEGIAGGQRTDAFAFAPDLVPTLLEAAGLQHPAERPEQGGDATIHPPTGRSAWPLLRGASDRVHPPDEAIGYELMTTAALFRGDYKLVRNGPPTGNGEWMLFDLAQDPGEREDLSERQSARRASMIQDFDSYAQRVGVVPVPEDYDVFKMLIGPPRSRPDTPHVPNSPDSGGGDDQ